MILKGTISITDDLNIIYNAPLGDGLKVINLDEDDILGEGANIIGGTCLLPPIDAKIAEVDGNEQAYDSIYRMHLAQKFQNDFIAALLAFLYKGGNLIFFLPDIGYTQTIKKLADCLYIDYGIHPAIIGAANPQDANWYVDMSCIPLWLNLIYLTNTITPQEYLLNLPIDADINKPEVINKLIIDINPYASTINEKIQYIKHFHKQVHKNPNVKPAIGTLR